MAGCSRREAIGAAPGTTTDKIPYIKTLDAAGKEIGDGRWLTRVGAAYYFAFRGERKHGGKFETGDAKRGFDCTTYIGSAYGLSENMDAYGTKLADGLGTTKAGYVVENKSGDEIKKYFKEYFATHKTGAFIMWSAKHVVMVVDGYIHEFSKGAGGYRKTDVQLWDFYGARHWVRMKRGVRERMPSDQKCTVR